MTTKVTFDMKNFFDYLEKIVESGNDVDAAADRALLAAAEVAKAGMERRVPKDTHKLKESIRIKGPFQFGNQHVIYIGVHPNEETYKYGMVQEFGSSDTPANPFVRTTMKNDRRKIKKAMINSLKADLGIDLKDK